MSLNVRVIAAAVVLVTSVAAQSVPEVLYYKFNEGSGSFTTNTASPGQGSANASLTGFQLSSTGGQFGGSLAGATSSTGTNRVNTGWTSNLGGGSWTVGFWINLNGVVGPNPAELMYVFGDPSSTWRCFINSSAGAGNVRLRGPLTELTSSGGPLTTGGHYVHFVYNSASTNLALYIDGVASGSVNQAGGINVSGTQAFQVGSYSGGGSPQSLRSGVRLDEFRLYSRALTTTEIAQTWNVSLSPSAIAANFSAPATSGPTPFTANFTDASTTTEPGGITSWMWNFGDGNTSTAQNPSHTYTVPGTYTVSLTVGDGVNPSQTQTRPDYITSGAYGFDVQTTGGGVGDLVLNAAPAPPGTTEGYTLFSTTPATVLGQGNFFGINFDDFVVTCLTSPAFINNPMHWLPTPTTYPNTTYALPAGALSQYAGVTTDAICIYIVNGQIVTSAIDRATF